MCQCKDKAQGHRVIANCRCLRPGQAKCPCGYRGTLVEVTAHVEAAE